MYERTLRLSCEEVSKVLYVVGTELQVNIGRCAPSTCKSFSVRCSPTVKYRISPPTQAQTTVTPLTPNSTLIVTMDTASEHAFDSKLSVRYYGEQAETWGTAVLHLTAVEISLDVDADRDGVVEKNNPNKGSWKWGPEGHGAILLVNCDSESFFMKSPDYKSSKITKVSDLKDMSRMVVRTKGPAELPAGYKLTLHVSQTDAEKIRVFRDGKQGRSPTYKNIFSYFIKDYPLVLSPDNVCQEIPYNGGSFEADFFVEGLRFADKDFNGLLTINLSLLEPTSPLFPETPIFTDKVMFHVAPWIMTPNTLDPLEVFICRTSDNDAFLKGMAQLVKQSGCELKICHEFQNRGDRWIQDEMEFGYIDSPHHRFPVVLDSPRRGDLDDYCYDELLGPDFGYVTRSSCEMEVNSLDSFGNLEVSPPVTVNGRSYPLGRIIIGVAFPTTHHGRNMAKVVQDFLWAQKVQEPIALFSDWLTVGHVDEFMSFVPAPDRKGFRLLLASPDAGYRLFHRLQSDGHGQAMMFEGVSGKKLISVDDILNDPQLKYMNNYVQGCIDWNRDVLKKELGLEEDDIIDLPILFHMPEEEEENLAVAYYPDMVNMIVLGRNLGVPKPFGPRVGGTCALEAELCALMAPLGLTCFFIDDFASYHEILGEVHCGSNTRRQPFTQRWWNLEPRE
ncbi:protein-arginine deiminase type-2 isoform X2 [Conger conger]|uniref:protein-arginine deiminase type-2 isoform X2 n=1 Tax=Conger conger TaxID=82655 RepID=UPI002A598FBD|nr:protein-arginine deiminase type-2 isoform X2 [Conger conger]